MKKVDFTAKYKELNYGQDDIDLMEEFRDEFIGHGYSSYANNKSVFDVAQAYQDYAEELYDEGDDELTELPSVEEWVEEFIEDNSVELRTYKD